MRVPAGVRPGDVVVARGQGQRGAGGASGDLELEIALKPHALFTFDAAGQLQCEVPVDLFTFLAGGVITVPTLWGKTVEFDLSAGRIQVFTGVGFAGRDGERGGFGVVARPEFPATFNDGELLALRTLASTQEAERYRRCHEVAAWHSHATRYVEQAGKSSAAAPGGTPRKR